MHAKCEMLLSILKNIVTFFDSDSLSREGLKQRGFVILVSHTSHDAGSAHAL